MSTRWYPIYSKGNPQLRVFLPNFWMKIVKGKYKLPANTVEFHCSMEMTKLDVKNYLEKIYKIPVIDIRTRIKMGKFRYAATGGYVVKDDDIKVAYAILPKDHKFVFPELFDKEEEKASEKEEKQTLKEMENGFKKFLKTNNKPGIPGWFGL
ncbi:39S ribosomal protein L23, mitochondrial [Fopius arisanus]|uniref:Large ribosomal subunit protein uL23m n=1 Tax=Fopius arisanus TaxID=64838 RepID=A0A0C9R6R9_9HYME|nr:PREDICTED: 39S ribosomal protein L23, mitochondrial [Fopius arisanus]